MLVAIDFDHTIWNSKANEPMPGAMEAINILREKGVKVIIHSCNNPSWIKRCLDRNDIRYDWIWEGYQGKDGKVSGGKPVADLYIDDCGFHFAGDWNEALPQILSRLKQRNPMIEGDTE